MKTKQRNRLVLGIAIAMIAFLLIYFNGQKVSDFINSVVIEAQLKKQYLFDDYSSHSSKISLDK